MSAWIRSQQIREFADALDTASPTHLAAEDDLRLWLEWVRAYADSIDPLVSDAAAKQDAEVSA
jgi:hypothetical protein